MTVWQASTESPRRGPAHRYSAQEYAILAVGLLVAMMVGIAASGALPLV